MTGRSTLLRSFCERHGLSLPEPDEFGASHLALAEVGTLQFEPWSRGKVLVEGTIGELPEGPDAGEKFRMLLKQCLSSFRYLKESVALAPDRRSVILYRVLNDDPTQVDDLLDLVSHLGVFREMLEEEGDSSAMNTVRDAFPSQAVFRP